jgi:16S rRNA (cytidine1402-2'-O)-methyltransferase
VNIFIFYESPKRITKTIKLMKNIFPKETQIAICREMTKIHEEIIRGNIEEVYANIQGRDLKGEISVVMQI